jgi:hypothetical protein
MMRARSPAFSMSSSGATTSNSCDEKGWRATFYTTGHGALSDVRDRRRVGAHAVAGGAVGARDSAEGRGEQVRRVADPPRRPIR